MNNNSMIEKFLQFAQNYKGDPRDEVQKLIESGQMSKEQFEYYSRLANELQTTLARLK